MIHTVKPARRPIHKGDHSLGIADNHPFLEDLEHLLKEPLFPD